MDSSQSIARDAAGLLTDIGAVQLAPAEPFTLTSGKKSPVYVDCRRIISFVAVRRRLLDFAVEQLVRSGESKWDAVAGGETAGIPFAAFLAERLELPMLYVRKQAKGLPMLYVRKQAKGFGRNRLLEGEWQANQRVLLVEDMMTDGGSKVHFIEALRAEGLICEDLFVFFRYGIFGIPEPALRELGVTVTALATWDDVLTALPDAALSPADRQEVRAFLADPAAWQERHP